MDKCKDPSCDGEYHYEICCTWDQCFRNPCGCNGQPQIKEDCPGENCPDCGAEPHMIHWVKCPSKPKKEGWKVSGKGWRQ